MSRPFDVLDVMHRNAGAASLWRESQGCQKMKHYDDQSTQSIDAVHDLIAALTWAEQWLRLELEEPFQTQEQSCRLNILVETAQAALAKATA